jgi:hypothetical protein
MDRHPRFVGQHSLVFLASCPPLSVYRPTFRPIYPSLSAYLPVLLSMYRSTYLPSRVSFDRPSYLAVYLPTYLPLQLSLSLSLSAEGMLALLFSHTTKTLTT